MVGDELPIEIDLLLDAGRAQLFDEIECPHAIPHQPGSAYPDVHH